MLPKLSEGSWSLVIFLINENYTASGKEISYICVFPKKKCYLMVHMKKIQTKMNTFSGSKTFHIRHDSLRKITLGRVMRLKMSNVTLLSSRGTLQEAMHILLWMLVKQLENLQ